MAQAAAESRYGAMWRRAENDAKRLADADEVYKKGDIRVASRMYVRLAKLRPPNPSTAAAKERLAQLAQEARQKLDELDATLEREAQTFSPGELLDQAAQPIPSPELVRWKEQVAAAFRQYHQIDQDYQGVPVVAHEIAAREAKQRKRAECAVVLNEPEAKVLLDAAKQHEADDHLCCAYWVYRQAARLVPAPSARSAAVRFAALEQDAQVVETAKACREIQQCHKIYNRAVQLAKVEPARAKELFAQICARAPQDTELYRAAQRLLSGFPQ